jgi:hypothetical protein
MLFKKRESKILAPMTKLSSLFSVELYPKTWVSPK